MRLEKRSNRRTGKQPIATGTGLLALDVVFTLDKTKRPQWFAGGTCGNVLTILSYLGWESVPVSRLYANIAAKRVIEDLEQWGVSTELITRCIGGSTPIIIERIKNSADGTPQHSFSWRCPTCGAHLPGYKPVLASQAHHIAENLRGTQVFFFDRVSRGSLVLAQKCREQGAIVVFEPSGVGDPSLFREAWSTAHIVKYAHERLREIADLDLPKNGKDKDGVLVEIETLGSAGLRYRSRLPHARTNGWITMDAFQVEHLKDSAGAGDWCTAGILDLIARDGISGLRQVTAAMLRAAMRKGQALATWNCAFEGARGGMYEVDRTEFETEIDHILKRSVVRINPQRATEYSFDHFMAQLCRSCEVETGILGRRSEEPKAG